MAPTASAPLNILVVDDNEDAAVLLGKLLSFRGHQVRVVHSGRDALDVFDEVNARVALIDIGMPGMNGYEVARALRERGSRIPLIAVTGFGQESDKRAAYDAGFDYHLTKPVSFSMLEAVFLQLSESSS
jgi:two-component system OmpR family response regulator